MSAQLQVKRKRLLYKPEQMAMAMQMVREGSMSKKAAAKAYGVPKSTLLDKLSGRVPEVPTRPGKKPTLTPAEEKVLIAYINLMHEIGYPVTRKELLREVKHILDIDGRNTPFVNNLPGKDWFSKFCGRHPEVSLRKPMALGHERASISFEMINEWFNGLFTYLKNEVPDYKSLLNDPRRFFNADESGFPLAVKSGCVLSPKGTRHVYQVVTNTKTQITVMASFNAFGEYTPPMILLPGERIRNVGLEGFPEAIYAATSNGWMDSETFVEYLKLLHKFAKEKEIQFPIILFVDGHSTHMSLPAAQFCHDNGIILYCLLANATHVLQACDIGLFSPLKSAWVASVKEWQLEHVGEVLTKKHFPIIFRASWYKVANFENACSAFRRSGLFPLTCDAIDKSKLGPSKLSVREPVPSGDNRPNIEGNTLTSSSVSSNCLSVPLTSVPTFTLNTSSAVPSFTLNTPSAVPSFIAKTSAVQSFTVNRSSALSSGHSIAHPTPGLSNTIPSKNPDFVSPAFEKLHVPEPAVKKARQSLRQVLPKALSGSAALKILKEREQKKIEETKAKELRKQERERKKKIKEEEKERKRRERESRKRIKELLEQKVRKHRVSDSSSESDVSVVYDDSDDYNEQGDFSHEENDDGQSSDTTDQCQGCGRSDGKPGEWIGCDECAGWWHTKCTGKLEFLRMGREELQKVYFKCKKC